MGYDQKILIIRFSSIGDIVLTTSPLNSLRNAFPRAQITFLTLDQFSPLLEYHPDIDYLISINKQSTIRELLELRRYLMAKDYDIIFDFHNSIRSNILTYNYNCKFYQIKKPRWNRFLLFLFHKNQFETDYSAIKMYHEAIYPITSKKNYFPKTKLSVSNYEKEKARSFLLTNGIVGNYLVIVPGAAWYQKQWHSSNYIRTLNQLKKPSILLGTQRDQICFQIAEKLNNGLNLAGKTTLREALAIIANADKLIGSDTGLTHAAEALSVPVIMILGPTSSETGASVNLSNSIKIEKDIWCRPCSQNGKFPCYRGKQYCLDSIEPQEVFQSINRI